MGKPINTTSSGTTSGSKNRAVFAPGSNRTTHQCRPMSPFAINFNFVVPHQATAAFATCHRNAAHHRCLEVVARAWPASVRRHRSRFVRGRFNRSDRRAPPERLCSVTGPAPRSVLPREPGQVHRLVNRIRRRARFEPIHSSPPDLPVYHARLRRLGSHPVPTTA